MIKTAFIKPRRWRSVRLEEPNEHMTAIYLKAIMRNEFGSIHHGPLWALAPLKGAVDITLQNEGALLTYRDEPLLNPTISVSFPARLVEAKVAEGLWDQPGRDVLALLKSRGVPMSGVEWPCCTTIGTLTVYFDDEFRDYVYEYHAPPEDDDEI